MIQNKEQVSRYNCTHDNSVDYKIGDTSKIMEILRDQIYSNKILAVIREYSTNALDSHILNGNPEEPFIVNLPTEKSNLFSIRDYGSGLSKEDIETIFTVYGTSTKDKSNEFTGTLGLGSKSAFCYTDRFNISSYFNGKAFHYVSYINEAGINKLDLVVEEDTNERNGLQIAIPVKDNFKTWEKDAFNVYKNFKVIPHIYHNDELSPLNESLEKYLKRKVYIGDIDGSKIYVNNNNSSPDLIMASISYNYSFSSCYGMQCTVEAPNGKLFITASRETLRFDKQTTEYLTDLTKKLYNNFFTMVFNKMFDNSLTREENRELLIAFSKINNRYRKTFLFKTKFNEKDLEVSITDKDASIVFNGKTLPLNIFKSKRTITPLFKTCNSNLTSKVIMSNQSDDNLTSLKSLPRNEDLTYINEFLLNFFDEIIIKRQPSKKVIKYDYIIYKYLKDEKKMIKVDKIDKTKDYVYFYRNKGSTTLYNTYIKLGQAISFLNIKNDVPQDILPDNVFLILESDENHLNLDVNKRLDNVIYNHLQQNYFNNEALLLAGYFIQNLGIPTYCSIGIKNNNLNNIVKIIRENKDRYSQYSRLLEKIQNKNKNKKPVLKDPDLLNILNFYEACPDFCRILNYTHISTIQHVLKHYDFN